MTKPWRNMNDAEKKQHKYEVKTARLKFEHDAKQPYKRTFKRKLKRKITARVISLAPWKIQTLKQHGAREMARRKHQIECEQLKVANGLVA